MGKKGWQRPSAEERAEHIRTLERLGRLVIDRSEPIAVWFVLMSYCIDSVAEPGDRAG